MSIEKEQYQKIKNNLNENVHLLVVSKQRSKEDILAYYDLGERMFGENRVPELIDKATTLSSDIEWHFIGHLQRNKVKQVLPYVSVLESLDSLELAKELEKECVKKNIILRVLAEFHLATEDTNKTGLSKEEAFSFVESLKDYPHLSLEGIMAMGPHTDDEDEVRRVFKEAKSLFDALQEKYGKEKIKTLSMGMTHDYKIAIEEGSTQVRIGTYLFQKEEL